MITAKVVADSLSPQGHRITTMEVVFPRFILAELNTHRTFSRNSASSRAIPFEKMVKMVQKNPFVPIAWQRDHKGMQGTEYLTAPIDTAFAHDLWLEARDRAVKSAKALYEGVDVTKQLCNRLLEPFMWHKVLITSTEWSNFWELRCPQYFIPDVEDNPDLSGKMFRSKKDLINALNSTTYGNYEGSIDQFKNMDITEQLSYNKGQAEIHMMALAEAMWDVYNESTPEQLEAGEWHIPYGDKIDPSRVHLLECFENSSDDKISLKIATARCARVSYTVVGEESKAANYANDIKLHDRLLESKHMSPFEHCAKATSDEEYEMNVNGNTGNYNLKASSAIIPTNIKGWCRNFRGFIQYRAIIENN